MNKKLNWMAFDCVDWLLSDQVDSMELAAQGAYIRLLAKMWLTDNCGFKNDEALLRRTLKPGSDSEWLRVHEQLLTALCVDDDGYLYSPRQRHEFNKAHDMADKRSRAGKAGGKASGAARKPPKADAPRTVAHAKPIKNAKRADAPRTSEPTAISNIVAAIPNIEYRDIEYRGSEHEVADWVGVKDWNESHGFFRWFVRECPNAQECLDSYRTSLDPVLSASKGQSPINSPGAYIRSWAKKALAKNEVQIDGLTRLPHDWWFNENYNT